MAVSIIKVRDSTQLAYEVYGRVQSLSPVVLIHSLAMDHTFWNAIAPALSEAHEIDPGRPACRVERELGASGRIQLRRLRDDAPGNVQHIEPCGHAGLDAERDSHQAR